MTFISGVVNKLYSDHDLGLLLGNKGFLFMCWQVSVYAFLRQTVRCKKNKWWFLGMLFMILYRDNHEKVCSATIRLHAGPIASLAFFG